MKGFWVLGLWLDITRIFGSGPDFSTRQVLNNTRPGPAQIKMLPGPVFITRPGLKKKNMFFYFFAVPAGLKKLKNYVFPLLSVPAGLKEIQKLCFSIFCCPCGAQKI